MDLFFGWILYLFYMNWSPKNRCNRYTQGENAHPVIEEASSRYDRRTYAKPFGNYDLNLIIERLSQFYLYYSDDVASSDVD